MVPNGVFTAGRERAEAAAAAAKGGAAAEHPGPNGDVKCDNQKQPEDGKWEMKPLIDPFKPRPIRPPMNSIYNVGGNENDIKAGNQRKAGGAYAQDTVHKAGAVHGKVIVPRNDGTKKPVAP